MSQTLLIRGDANAQMGTGHVMRCLALAQAWQDIGGKALFVMVPAAPSLEARLRAEGMGILPLRSQPGSPEDASELIRYAKEHKAEWTVVDGYQFGAEYQRQVKAAGVRLLWIDDGGHAQEYCADWILNQNIHADEALYRHQDPSTQLLLGTRYALLRREFLSWRGWRRDIPEVARKVLVTLGGSDAENVTLKVIQALDQIEVEGIEATVVIGTANPHGEALEVAVKGSSLPIRLQRAAEDMPALMAWADVAIAGAGVTAWELAFMGLPSLTVILAANQRPLAEGLSKAAAASNLGSHGRLSTIELARELKRVIVDPAARREMSRRGRLLVDGGGTGRVLARVRSRALHLREAQEEDCRLLWEWASDPEVRAVSFSSDPIPWEGHKQWFASKLSDAGCRLYLATNGDGIPIGQIRYEIHGQDATVSISVDRRYRDQGYGSLLLRSGLQKVFEETDVAVAHAYLKSDNEASAKLFAKGGFQRMGLVDVHGQQAVHFLLRKTRDHDNGTGDHD